MSTITEKLGLGGNTRELKLGKSFQNFRSSRDGHGSNVSSTFNSIRYDFKPASIDTSKKPGIELGENNKVTVTMPNVESSGLPHTVFKGSRKPHVKECVLIIDHDTGELTLERLSHNITVKKTRAEGSSRAAMPRPITPSIEVNNGNGNMSSSTHHSRKSSPSVSSASVQNGRLGSPKIGLTGSSSSSSSSHFLHAEHSHQNGSPGAASKSSPNLSNFGSLRSPYVQSSLSQPTSVNISSLANLNNCISSSQGSKMDDDMIGILSESSSDSSDNDSSSSNNSDSSSDEEESQKIKSKNGIKNRKDDSSSKGESSSSGSDSGSDSGNEQDCNQSNNKVRKAIPNSNGGLGSGSSVPPSMPNMLSMPKFSQLSTYFL